MNNKTAFKINKTQNNIVALCKIFSGHLLVVGHEEPLIVLRFKVTFLFCNNITKTSNIDIITIDMYNNCINFIFY